jgi:SAM-dependent methyltransferase
MVIAQPYRILTSRVIKKNSDYIKGIVLDAGGGPILRYKDLFKYNKYITVDIDPSSKADLVCSIEKIDLPNNSIDSIVCTGTLGDIYNPEIPIKEFNRLLKRNGLVMLVDNFAGFMHDQPVDYFRFTNFYLEKVFINNGFEIIKTERIGGFFSLILQLKIEYLIRKLNLYNHLILGRIVSRLFYYLFLIANFLDSHDKSRANRCCAIAWLIIAKKIKEMT